LVGFRRPNQKTRENNFISNFIDQNREIFYDLKKPVGALIFYMKKMGYPFFCIFWL
jgi:hypothetical protein